MRRYALRALLDAAMRERRLMRHDRLPPREMRAGSIIEMNTLMMFICCATERLMRGDKMVLLADYVAALCHHFHACRSNITICCHDS